VHGCTLWAATFLRAISRTQEIVTEFLIQWYSCPSVSTRINITRRVVTVPFPTSSAVHPGFFTCLTPSFLGDSIQSETFAKPGILNPVLPEQSCETFIIEPSISLAKSKVKLAASLTLCHAMKRCASDMETYLLYFRPYISRQSLKQKMRKLEFFVIILQF
jgi:hypothetical protein